MNPSKVPQPMKSGYRVSVKSSRGNLDESKEKVMPFDSHSPEKTASVGMSVSTGMSKEYGSEKFEVVVWCTLPSLPDAGSIADTYDECYSHVERELTARTNMVLDKFFPEEKKK